MKNYKLILMTRSRSSLNSCYNVEIKNIMGYPNNFDTGFYDEDNVFRVLGNIEINPKTMDVMMYILDDTPRKTINRYVNNMIKLVKKRIEFNDLLNNRVRSSLSQINWINEDDNF